MTCTGGAIGALTLALLLCEPGFATAQSAGDTPAPATIAPPSSDLTAEKVSHLKAAMTGHDYVAAEELLIKEIEPDPHSARAGRLLAYLGSVYFLNRDYLNAAVAWKKSDAITPLESGLEFSLAMAYIRISHPDWARPVLESLSVHDSKNALYPYWLGRLDYDAQRYSEAIHYFQQAIALDPTMARAYDNLGLCYFYQNENAVAVKNYQRAIELDRNALHPSPWPYLNLAVTQQFLGQTQEAEANLREALRLDPEFATAHYRLGTVLEHQGQLEAAVPELVEAARLDDKYAEPHIALAHIYSQLGKKEAAQQEVQIYRRLRGEASDPSHQPAVARP
jgi:tetratricopeptide (TPR) repeat protein